jgi:hypothetical protein
MLLREKALQINPQIPLTIGASSMVIFILLERFVSGYSVVDFLSGMFCGISVAFNIWGLWLFGRQRRAR